mmetsp:Transcript_15495/g.31928  ORF Transcript_15495/g.31928 Transcript_15495/m.31928 type:complete len:205 (+) Transcript_15495:197-811(+)
MSSSPNSQEVEVSLVPRNVSAHPGAGVQGPGPPRLLLLQTKATCPVLCDERVDTRVRVAVVNHDPHSLVLVLAHSDILIERHEILFREVVNETDAIVAREEVGVLRDVERVPDLGYVGVDLHCVPSPANVVIESSSPFRVLRPRSALKKAVFVRAVVVQCVFVVTADLVLHVVKLCVALVAESAVCGRVLQGVLPAAGLLDLIV